MVEVTHTEVSYLGEEHFNKGNSITEAWSPSMLGMPGTPRRSGWLEQSDGEKEMRPEK